MNKNAVRHFFRTTSFKLLLIFGVSCFLIVMLFSGIFRRMEGIADKDIFNRNKNRVLYAQFLTTEIEKTGNFDLARDYARELGMEIHIESPLTTFDSRSMLPSVAEVERLGVRRIWDPHAKTGRLGHRYFAIIERGEKKYLYFFHSDTFSDIPVELGYPFVTLLLSILLLSYLFIRWLFKPVQWLSEGVHQVSEGNLEIRVKRRRGDELGDLAQAFNEMVTRVQHIVVSRQRFLLDVSHELRSPLTRIKVALELEGERAKELIKKNIRILESMIDELLEAARLSTSVGALHIENTEISSLIDETLSGVKDEKPGVVFVGVIPRTTLSIDPARVRGCLQNVIGNAFKYSNFQDKPVEVSASTDEHHYFIFIRDHGVGIPPDETKLIFEPFYRVDKSRTKETGGYGLGLSICKNIMDMHGGAISVVAPADLAMSGGGSVFILKFQK